MLRESSQNQIGRPKKRSKIFLKNCPPPSPRKILVPPLLCINAIKTDPCIYVKNINLMQMAGLFVSSFKVTCRFTVFNLLSLQLFDEYDEFQPVLQAAAQWFVSGTELTLQRIGCRRSKTLEHQRADIRETSSRSGSHCLDRQHLRSPRFWQQRQT